MIKKKFTNFKPDLSISLKNTTQNIIFSEGKK